MKKILGLLMMMGLMVSVVGCASEKGPQGLPVQKSWPSGRVEVEGNFKDGEKDGKWVRYDGEGNLTDEDIYLNPG